MLLPQSVISPDFSYYVAVGVSGGAEGMICRLMDLIL